MYCPHCEEDHVASPTYDNLRNQVGNFCNRKKLLTAATTALWDGESITSELMRFVDENVDMAVLKRMDNERIPFLAKRIAFQLLQTKWAKERRLNFAFAQYWLTHIIRTVWTDLQPEGGH